MNKNKKLSRRDFLNSAGAISSISCLRIAAPALVSLTQAACSAKEQRAAFVTLGEAEATDFAANALEI